MRSCSFLASTLGHPGHPFLSTQFGVRDTNENDNEADDEDSTDETAVEVGGSDTSADDSDDKAEETEDEDEHRCDDCGVLVSFVLSSLMEHEHCDMDDSTLWSCGTCKREIKTLSERIKHLRDIHEGDSDREIDFTERVVDVKKDNA